MIEQQEAAAAEWAELPFVTAQNGRIVWAANASGDYSADCATGRGYARDAVAYVERTGDAPILSRLFATMPGDDQSGVEIGFLTALIATAARPNL